MRIDISTEKIMDATDSSENSMILPYSIKVYNGFVYVIDRLTSKLYKYNKYGEGGEVKIVGTKFIFPYDLEIINSKLYVADGGNYRIAVCSLEGEFLFEFGGCGFEENQFNNGGIFNGDGRSSNPQNFFIGGDKKLHVIDIIEKKIKIFDEKGVFFSSYTLPDLKSYGVGFVGDSGQIYMTDPASNKVKCFNHLNSLNWEIGGVEGNSPKEFKIPWRVIEHNSKVYVSDIYNHRIQVFDLEGNFLEMFGKQGADRDSVNYIFGFDFDEHDNIFLTDTWNHRIKKLKSDYSCDKIWGFFDEKIVLRPAAIKITEQGDNFWVADYLNHCLKLFDLEGNFIKKVGNLGVGDGEFRYPNDIFISEDSRIYVSDSKNNRIQIFDAEGNWIRCMNFGDYNLNMETSSVVCKNDKMFVADILNSQIHHFDLKTEMYLGIFMNKGDLIGEVLSKYKTEFIRLDIKEDVMIIADPSNNRVQKYDFLTQSFFILTDNNCMPTRARNLFENVNMIINRGSHEICFFCGKDLIYSVGKGLGNKKEEFIAPWDADYSIIYNKLVVADSLNNRMKIISCDFIEGE